MFELNAEGARVDYTKKMPTEHVFAGSLHNQGIGLLCAAGGDPHGRSLFGAPALAIACYFGAVAAREELLAHAEFDAPTLSYALFLGMVFRGGTAESVHRLVALRADVDFQWRLSCLSPLGFIFRMKSAQHRLGKPTLLSELAFHFNGMTPLMAAVFSAQYEGAAGLIAAGARLDLTNCRGWIAADFARGRTLPKFLMQGLAGDRSECQRVTRLVLSVGAGAYVECKV